MASIMRECSSTSALKEEMMDAAARGRVMAMGLQARVLKRLF